MARGRLAQSGSGQPPGPTATPSTAAGTGQRRRSRSPRNAPAPAAALRRDAPARLPRSTGAFPDLTTEARREEALADLARDIYAPSNRTSVASRLRMCELLLAGWGLPMAPPTVQSITALGASLKAGRYRSAAVYLSTYKTWTARQGHSWSTTLQQAMTDAIRSCERGLGGPVKARALPFARLGDLPGGDDPWTPGGPMRPRNAIVIGSWFLTRELELSTASAAALELSFPRPGVPQVKFHLPASKSDVQATGTAREHGCSCNGVPGPSCPAHAAWDHLTFLRSRFADRWPSALPPSPELPLFPTALGTACTKDAMIATISHAASLLGVELSSPDGSERVSGHSLRATGAQGLAAAGIDTWAIELMGRWGSEAVRGYIREARLADATAMTRRVAESLSLEALVRRLVSEQCGSAATASSSSAQGPLPHPPTAVAPQAPATSDEASLQAIGAAACPALGVHASLAAEVTLARAAAALSPAVAVLVKNSVTGVVHRAVKGFDESPAAEWLSACGWRFGLSTWRAAPTRIAAGDLPRVPQLLCARCLPVQRRAASEALAAQAD